jgi:sensor histidine kinase YesM
MKFKPRYKIWTVAFYVLAAYLLFALVALVALALIPNKEAAKEMEAVKSLSVKSYFIRYGIGYVFHVAFFYFAANYYYALLARKSKFLSYFKVSIILTLANLAYHLLLYNYLPEALRNNYASIPLLFFVCTLNSCLFLAISLVVAYLTNSREGQKQRKILEAQKLQLEIEKTQANFNFLKAQINPHFLHNTLNFLYAKSLPYSSELSEGILTLSDIMRYALSQGNEKDGKAPLTDEIEHMRNVIKISQLRFSNKLKVNFEVNGVLNGAMIIPFVLITLVENAFKHGDLKNPDTPIDIKLNVEGNKLYFYCRNKKKTGPKELSTGIGLDNIRNRLDLAYGSHYKFVVKDEAEFYTTELTIDQL